VCMEVSVYGCSKAKDSVPGASNKLGD